MVDLALFQGAVTGLKTAADIAIGISKLKTMTEVTAKAIELQQVILSAQSDALAAQSAQFSLIERIRDLEDELTEMKAWETEKQRYKLITPWTGSLTYGLKESMKGAEPPHYLCTNCYEDGRKSILNHNGNSTRWTSYVCPVCTSEIPTGCSGAVAAEYAPD